MVADDEVSEGEMEEEEEEEDSRGPLVRFSNDNEGYERDDDPQDSMDDDDEQHIGKLQSLRLTL